MRYYTGIGSRDVPQDIDSRMRSVGYSMGVFDWTLRSGKAKGSDEAFQTGLQGFISQREGNPTKYAEVYIPWRGFKGGEGLLDCWDIVPPDMSKSEDIAKLYHPAWDRCSQGAKKMHCRNVNQVLGMDLNTPSEFVLFYAPESKGKVKGGTATAVNLARDKGIPTINMLFDDWMVKVREVVYE